MADVGVGDVGPAGLVLHANGVAAGVDGLDEGGADAAHRVEDQVAGFGVGLDGVGGDRRQHPRRVLDRVGYVAAAALGRSGLLGGDPDGQDLRRHQGAGIGGGFAAGLVGVRGGEKGALSHGHHPCPTRSGVG